MQLTPANSVAFVYQINIILYWEWTYTKVYSYLRQLYIKIQGKVIKRFGSRHTAPPVGGL